MAKYRADIRLNQHIGDGFEAWDEIHRFEAASVPEAETKAIAMGQEWFGAGAPVAIAAEVELWDEDASELLDLIYIGGTTGDRHSVEITRVLPTRHMSHAGPKP